MIMRDVLIIKSKAMLRPEQLHKAGENFKEQLKTGLVIIPAWFEAELISVPDDIQVVVESEGD